MIPPQSAPSAFPWTLSSVRDSLSQIGIEEEFPIDCQYAQGKKACKTNPRQQALRNKGRVASVLVLLSSDLHVLLTLRSRKLKSHPGQVSFPGGKQDPSDGGDDFVTALRETKEEVGLDYTNDGTLQPQRSNKKHRTNSGGETDETVGGDENENDSGFSIVCRMPSTEAIGNLCVVPIVALHKTKPWEELHRELNLNQDEVETAFWAPLSWFSDARHLNECYEVPNWPVEGESFVYRSYSYEFPLTQETFTITGLTAGILHEVAMVACGRNNLEEIGDASTNEQDGNSEKQVATTNNNNNKPPLRGVLKRGMVRESRTKQWTEAFFVLLENSGSTGGGILHQYDSVEHALRKQQSANKKNRLRLMPNTPTDESCTRVEEIDNRQGETNTKEQLYPFRISTLNGRIQWELSASSPKERRLWVERIKSIVKIPMEQGQIEIK